MEEFQKDVLTRLARMEEHLKYVPRLVGRVEALERDRARLVGWLAGIGTMAGGVGALLARLGLLILPLAMAGCAAVPIHVPPPPPAAPLPEIKAPAWPSWSREAPVPFVISSDLTDECLIQVVASLAFWDSHGVSYLEPMLADQSIVEQALGTIRVTSEPLTAEEIAEHTAAQTTWMWVEGLNEIVDAKIQILPNGCDLLYIAHEIGHALGLPHSEDPMNLMFFAPMRMDLDAQQLEHVR